MTREIKFRAWDIESKKMYKVAFPTWNGMIETRDGDHNAPTFFLTQNGEEQKGVLMQFIGSKDKNGKEGSVEIYDGDLMRDFPNGFEPREIFEVCWINNGWWMKTKSAVNHKELIVPIDTSFEVIGNIYEDENLLNK